MSATPPLIPEDRAILAGELALGLLEGEQLEGAIELARTDPEFSSELASWAGRFSSLLDELGPVAPPDSLWQSIELLTQPKVGQPDNVVTLRRRVGFWQVCTGVTTALAASLALVLAIQPGTFSQTPVEQTQQEQSSKPMVAMLTTGREHPALMASWEPGSRHLLVEASAPMPAAKGRDHQLWVIPADGKPRSVGVMPAEGPMEATIDAGLARTFANGATLAVSDEPRGGSPTGLPTGPVVASGKLAHV